LLFLIKGVGGDFTLYDGQINGKNVELITDAKIVQKWRMQDWPAWHFSTGN
jgi:activator of HSP90 ATPase